jgi:hypothetical protein
VPIHSIRLFNAWVLRSPLKRTQTSPTLRCLRIHVDSLLRRGQALALAQGAGTGAGTGSLAMADLIARRPSAAVQPSPHIPEPPPLPPSKTSYFSRLVYGSRPQSAQFSASRLDAGRPNPLVPKLGYVAVASLSHHPVRPGSASCLLPHSALLAIVLLPYQGIPARPPVRHG